MLRRGGRIAQELLDHLVGDREEPRRKGQAERLGGLEVDSELELGWLLHRQVRGLGALEDLVNVAGGTPKQVNKIYPVGHEAAGCHKFPKSMNRRQLVRGREICNELPISERERVFDRNQSVRSLPSCSFECAIEVVRASNLQGVDLYRQGLTRCPRFFEDKRGIRIGRIPKDGDASKPGKHSL